MDNVPKELRMRLSVTEIDVAFEKSRLCEHDVLVKHDGVRSAFVTPNGKLYYVLT